jgi:hypothetical protein
MRTFTASCLVALAACGSGSGGGGGGGGGSSIPPFSLYWSVAVTDIDGDGLLDAVTSYSRISGAPPHPGFVAVYRQDRTDPGHFLPAVTYAAGDDPVSIAVGDLNGDGRADIVTTNAILSSNGAGASTITVLLQDPARPGQFLAATSYAAGTNPQSVAIEDLNDDGLPDLAVADNLGISLLLQNPGAPGTFLPRTAISVGAPTASIAIADLTGNGRRDLVVTTAASVLVLLQDPQTAGSFLAPMSYSAGAQPIFAAVGDLDEDGKLDIAVANLGSPADASTASVSVLLQDSAGSGSFLPAITYATDLRSATVAIADLNGDGKLDLAVANGGTLAGPCPPTCSSTGASVSILLQNPAAPGQFLAATNYPGTGSDYISAAWIADMNGDGKADLIIAQGSGVFIRFQDSLHPGQFLAAVPISN